MTRICIVKYCSKSHQARGFCNTHYGRWWRGGNPHEKSQMEKTPTERFLESFDKGGVDECWEWQARRVDYGYGILRLDGQEVRAHRFSFEYYGHEIPEGMCILHRCDNPPCVNYHHLFIGTKKDNHADMFSKGRHCFPQTQGEHNSQAKLCDGDIRLIRQLVQKGSKQVVVANLLNVTKQCIHSVVHRNSWSHIK